MKIQLIHKWYCWIDESFFFFCFIFVQLVQAAHWAGAKKLIVWRNLIYPLFFKINAIFFKCLINCMEKILQNNNKKNYFL